MSYKCKLILQKSERLLFAALKKPGRKLIFNSYPVRKFTAEIMFRFGRFW